MSKIDIRNLSFQQLSTYLESIHESTFRAKQIFEWLYKKNKNSFSQMNNIPITVRSRLEKDFVFNELSVATICDSSDGTKKIVFILEDQEKIETVIIPTAQRTTLCVSTQVGCKFGCKFCASGLGGFKRNLSCAEILGQILYVKNMPLVNVITHIVFMGVGEPLDNYDNVIKAVRTINDKKALNIAARRITISTCGLIPQIKELSREGLQIELSISLHGADDITRSNLMPVTKRYPLGDLIAECKRYAKETNRQVTFEYILIKNINCSKEDARKIAQLLGGMISKINLIVYNKVKEFDYQPPSKEDVMFFKRELDKLNVHSTIRAPRGRDIAAACGQLRHITN